MTLHHHHPPTHLNSMSAISQLLVARFWSNFKDRFLGTSRTDSNCYGDIYPGNICPGDICPYQEYLSCYCFGPNKLFCSLNLWDLKFFWPTHFSDKIFWTKKFSNTIFFDPIYFGPKICRKQNFSNPIFFRPKICRHKYF